MSPAKSGVSGGRIVRCPACGGKSRYAADNPFRPFCSERCRDIDLGAWASESYRVSAALAAEEDAAEVPARSRH